MRIPEAYTWPPDCIDDVVGTVDRLLKEIARLIEWKASVTRTLEQIGAGSLLPAIEGQLLEAEPVHDEQHGAPLDASAAFQRFRERARNWGKAGEAA